MKTSQKRKKISFEEKIGKAISKWRKNFPCSMGRGINKVNMDI